MSPVSRTAPPPRCQRTRKVRPFHAERPKPQIDDATKNPGALLEVDHASATGLS
ncbi:MAG: hypothetical protein M3467_08665 [Actinomycetota bacterium]|nr:hypothetical protein [Actinomycetota bacterium]